MLRPGNQNPGPFKPRPVPVPPRVPPRVPPVNPGPFKPSDLPPARPEPSPIVNRYPGPMKPPEVPLPTRGRVGGFLSPGAGFGQNDVLEAIFSRLGY